MSRAASWSATKSPVSSWVGWEPATTTLNIVPLYLSCRTQGKVSGTGLSTTTGRRTQKKQSTRSTGCACRTKRSRCRSPGQARTRSRAPTCTCPACPRAWPSKTWRICSTRTGRSSPPAYYVITLPAYPRASASSGSTSARRRNGRSSSWTARHRRVPPNRSRWSSPTILAITSTRRSHRWRRI